MDRYGPPPLWARRPGFATLVKIILEQQVSLASGHAVYLKLQAVAGRVTPHKVSRLSIAQLRRIGLTRQKAAYCSELAHLIVSGGLDLQSMKHADDETVRERLTRVKGIGTWTASIYLLMALRRPDVWPDGDVALAEAARQVKGLRKRPDFARLQRMAARWTPWRSVAARILWHAYLSRRRAKGFR